MSSPSSLAESVEGLMELHKGQPGDLPSLLRLLEAVGLQANDAERPAVANSAKILAESIESAVRNKSHPSRLVTIIDSALERLRRKCLA